MTENLLGLQRRVHGERHEQQTCEPDQAATSIANGLEKRRNEIIFPLPMALLMKAARVVPVGLWSTLTRVRDHSTDNRRSTTPAEFTRR